MSSERELLYTHAHIVDPLLYKDQPLYVIDTLDICGSYDIHNTVIDLVRSTDTVMITKITKDCPESCQRRDYVHTFKIYHTTSECDKWTGYGKRIEPYLPKRHHKNTTEVYTLTSLYEYIDSFDCDDNTGSIVALTVHEVIPTILTRSVRVTNVGDGYIPSHNVAFAYYLTAKDVTIKKTHSLPLPRA